MATCTVCGERGTREAVCDVCLFAEERAVRIDPTGQAVSVAPLVLCTHCGEYFEPAVLTEHRSYIDGPEGALDDEMPQYSSAAQDEADLVDLVCGGGRSTAEQDGGAFLGCAPSISMLPPAAPQWVVGQADPGPPRMSLLEFQHSDHPVAQEDVVRQATEEIAKWTRVVALLETLDTFIDCALGTEQIGARQDAIHLIHERIAFFQQALACTREQQAGIRFLLASAFALARASVVPAKPEGDTNV